MFIRSVDALWRPFLTSTACKALQGHVDRIVAATASDVSTEWIMNIHLLGEHWLLDLAREPALLDAVERICGQDVTLMQSHVFCKPRGCPPTPWHQDGRSDDDAPMATVWITLDDINAPSSGGLCVLPGLHIRGLLPSDASDHFQFDRVLSSAFVSTQTPVPYALRAGEAAVHHPLLPHASAPNTRLPYRRVLVLRYLATAALEAAGVPLYGARGDALELLRPAQTDGDDDDDGGEFYQDYRDADVYFEGRSIVVRGRHLE
ncbi:hypothetical protein ACHHYP_01378 [Achlya hypogyna]|uniref:Phytanoyl-CoA dioxygenase n=1 Tax=Achlya hypogyna TaxID=1202772 RepID=A0A1V9ZTJ4_ACHHY|nr:hypothetical protein ACHHYP_01378 [Achlya hypogyna]